MITILGSSIRGIRYKNEALEYIQKQLCSYKTAIVHIRERTVAWTVVWVQTQAFPSVDHSRVFHSRVLSFSAGPRGIALLC